VPHFFFGPARCFEQRRRVAHEHFTGGRERHATRAALEHAGAERRFEPRDVLGHRRLREVQRRGGLTEGPADGDFAERRQELQVEHHGALCHSFRFIIGHDHGHPARCCP
jgi:hypothetical protein